MKDKNFIVTYRQFARGRRSLKTIIIPAPTQEVATQVFNMAIRFCRMENPFKFNNTKLISVFEEG